MVNIVGEPGYAGKTKYVGIEECMSIEGAHLHLYGKTETRPFRKMGHINIADKDRKKVLENIEKIKSTLRVIS
jgi:5-(carboxyamino)imidazole ribonucleotide synthase